MRVYDIAHSRTGDKGNISTISACAYRPEDYPVLAERLTAEKVMEQFAPLGVTHVDRYAQLSAAPDDRDRLHHRDDRFRDPCRYHCPHAGLTAADGRHL